MKNASRAALLAATLLLLSLSGCGNKGPLYLPDETVPADQETAG